MKQLEPLPPTKFNNVGNTKDLRASKLIELCQGKIDSMEENTNSLSIN